MKVCGCRWRRLAVLAHVREQRQAQFIIAGSTPEGDYLRGVGIAGWGMGLYNLNTAQADSINLDTAFAGTSISRPSPRSRPASTWRVSWPTRPKRKEFYKQNRERILDSPEARDVLNGDALNRILEELLNSNLGESVFRSDRMQVPIPVDVVRHIPFKLGEKGEQFSMDRLSLKGKGTWTVALQDKQFDYVKKAYARALDKALEQAIDGKMQIAAIEEVEAKADDLFRRLNEVVGPSNDPTLYRSQGTTERAEIHRAACSRPRRSSERSARSTSIPERRSMISRFS